MYRWIIENLPAGSHILELGSGDASTNHLSKHYRMTSVEDKQEFLNRYQSRYIYAPLVNGWYDLAILQTQLPRDYDLLLVDGPTGSEARSQFYPNRALFKTNVPIIIDDTWRPAEKTMALNLTAEFNFGLIVDPNFCILIPPSWASGKH